MMLDRLILNYFLILFFYQLWKILEILFFSEDETEEDPKEISKKED